MPNLCYNLQYELELKFFKKKIKEKKCISVIIVFIMTRKLLIINLKFDANIKYDKKKAKFFFLT
jgi:hypothetical protein